MTDPLLVRWPHRPLAGLPVACDSGARETGARDAATVAALEAYLSAGREVPVRSELRL